MNKKLRESIFNKYGGRCAYCGCELVKGWHVDHFEPIRRNVRSRWDIEKQKYVSALISVDHPEREIMENYMPSCASCNINKHSDSLENFRKLIAGFMKHLNEVSTQYKIAKRYGLITETAIEVKFYFETIKTT